MKRALLILTALFLLSAGCSHTPGVSIPPEPAASSEPSASPAPTVTPTPTPAPTATPTPEPTPTPVPTPTPQPTPPPLTANAVRPSYVPENEYGRAKYHTFDHAGTERAYQLFIPDTITENAPLVFMLHGYADSAANFMRTTDMNRIAAHYGFAVCYPQGAKSSDTEFPYNHWNADFTYTTNDDTGFLSDLAAYLQETYHLSPDATFAAGLSNGGFMAYTLAVKAPGVFRAVGVVAGSMSGKSWEDRAAAQAIPIVHIHGRGDTTIGIYGTFIGGGWGGAPEINTILEYWAELAGLENEEEYEGDKVILRTYSSAESDTQIKYYLIKGLEHAWPIVANSTLDTPAVLWEFFSQYVPKE